MPVGVGVVAVGWVRQHGHSLAVEQHAFAETDLNVVSFLLTSPLF